MGWNVPDDWGNYYSTCSDCGYRAHGSEGYWCPCAERCSECGEDHSDCECPEGQCGYCGEPCHVKDDGDAICDECQHYCEVCGSEERFAHSLVRENGDVVCDPCLAEIQAEEKEREKTCGTN